MTSVKLLSVKDIVEIYNLPRSTVYELMHIRIDPCPRVKGGKGKRYLVEQSVFEEWLKNRKVCSC